MRGIQNPPLLSSFFGYLSGFVHCFVGYWIAFRHVYVVDLGCSGAGFTVISGEWGLIGVPPSPLLAAILGLM